MDTIGLSMRQARFRRGGRRAILWGVTIVLLFGCGKSGPKIVAVSGDVTLDSAPLTEANIQFVSKTGSVASARLDSGGRFRLISQYGKGIPAGEYLVYILPVVQFDPHDPKQMSTQSKLPKAVSPIPPRYQNPQTSGLTASVTSGKVSLSYQISTAP